MGFFQTLVGLDDVIIGDVLSPGEDKQLNKVLGITEEGSAVWFYNKLLDSGLTIVNYKCFMYSIEP